MNFKRKESEPAPYGEVEINWNNSLFVPISIERDEDGDTLLWYYDLAQKEYDELTFRCSMDTHNRLCQEFRNAVLRGQ